MRPWLTIALIAAAFIPAPAAASCAAPFIEVQPDAVRPGDQLHVSGEFFLDGCNDTGGSACGLIPQAPEPEPPMTDVRLELRRAGEIVEAVEVDADDAGRLEADLMVPEDAEPGRYAVESVYGGYRQQRVTVKVAGG